MSTTDKIFANLNKLADGHSAQSVVMGEMRPLIHELSKELGELTAKLAFAQNRISFHENNDHYKDARSWEKRHGEVTALSNSYLTTIDAAMKCVEAVIAAMPQHRKAEVDSRGAEFFADAARKLPKWVRQHADDAASTRVENCCGDLARQVRETRDERNIAVRKQLDLERDLRGAKQRIETLTALLQSEVAKERAENAKLLKECSDKQARIDTLGSAGDKRVENLESERNAMCAALTKANQRVAELEDERRSSDRVSDDVNKVMETWTRRSIGPNLTQENWREEVCKALRTLSDLSESSTDRQRRVAELETSNKAMSVVVAAISDVFKFEGGWWVRCEDPAGLIRTRIERAMHHDETIIAGLRTEVEKLTDAIHDLRKDRT